MRIYLSSIPAQQQHVAPSSEKVCLYVFVKKKKKGDGIIKNNIKNANIWNEFFIS